MATVTPSPRTAPAPAVMHPLDRLRGTIRRYVTLEGAAVVGIFLALWFWLGLAFDFGAFKAFNLDWVQELPRGARAALLVALVLSLVAVVAVKVVRRLLVEFRPQALALVLERRFPAQLGDRLITAVELADLDRAAEQGYSRAMVEQTIREAADRVATVPVHEVFNRRRLWWLGAWFLVLSLGLLILVGAAHAIATQTNPLTDFAVRFKHVASIWFERNVLLRDTIWPRQAHLELLDFPSTGDLRVGRDAPSPRLRVRAVKWLVADASAGEGWRAMTWDDLTPELAGGPVPALPADLLEGRLVGPRAVAAVAVAATAAPPLVAPALGAAASRADVPPRAVWPLDRVDLALANPEVQARLRDALGGDEYLALTNFFDRLAERAVDPDMARTFRCLDVPERVEINYWGAKTSSDMPFPRGNDQEYAGTLSDLKESVKFRVRASDYATAVRTITLVPPPTLTRLTRDELQPAYLYHRAPLGAPPDGGAAALKGLKQFLPDRAVSLSGAVSQFTVPSGTDLQLSGLLDKELTSAVLLPRARKGSDPGPLGPTIALTLTPDRLGFINRFTAVTAPLDFDLEFTDTDLVSSRRHVLIEPVRDAVPKVNVVIEGVRKTGAGFMVTPVATIPFAGTVGDNSGLDKVDYELTVQRLETSGVLGNQAGWAAGVAMHFAPLDPASLLGGTAVTAEVARTLVASAPEAAPKTLPLRTFEEVYRDKALKDVLKAELMDRLRQVPAASPLIAQFDVKPQYELLDLRDRLPNLKVKDEQQLQPRYRLRVTITATDNNVETGPGVGPNKEPPFTVLVVSEAELLVEIGKEEQNLHFKLEDTVARLRDARLRLDKVAEQLPTLPREQLQTMSLRAQEVVDATTKGRDVTQEVYTDYGRILRELELNRVMPKLVEKVKGEIVFPLEAILREEFVRAEQETEAYRKELEAGRKPSDEATQKARQALDQLIERLSRVMDAMGDVTSINKLIALLRDIEKGQEQDVGNALKRIKAEKQKELLEKLKKAGID